MANTNDAVVKIQAEEARKQSNLLAVQYPSDLMSQSESKYTKFRITQYEKKQINKVETTVQLGTIFLPIPPELSNGDALNYEEFSAPILNTAIDAMGQDGLNQAVSGLVGFSAVIGAELLGKTNATKNIVNQASAFSGASVNPRNANIFKNPTAREHKFTFRMVAKSEEESIAIRKITNKFRYHAYPNNALDEAIYIAPDIFNISFHMGDDVDSKNTYLFHPLPSALVAMSVNYNGSSTPTFFRHSNAPVEVMISLVFREMELDNKNKLEYRYGVN